MKGVRRSFLGAAVMFALMCHSPTAHAGVIWGTFAGVLMDRAQDAIQQVKKVVDHDKASRAAHPKAGTVPQPLPPRASRDPRPEYGRACGSLSD